MTKLQAAMRDASAKKWTENRRYYRVGSCFKACANCGEKGWNKRGTKQVFISGMSVFRSYKPKDIGWTYACTDCGAKDALCWKGAWDIGLEPRILPRDDISPFRGETNIPQYTLGQYRKDMREKTFPTKNVPKDKPLNERERAIMALEAKLQQLQEMLKG